MDNKSKHSLVRKWITLAFRVSKMIVRIHNLLVELHERYPELVELFNMAFNYDNLVEA